MAKCREDCGIIAPSSYLQGKWRGENLSFLFFFVIATVRFGVLYYKRKDWVPCLKFQRAKTIDSEYFC